MNRNDQKWTHYRHVHCSQLGNLADLLFVEES